MKKIEGYIGAAPKVSGHGQIHYVLWVDAQGHLFIQLIANDESGTFSNLAFSVSEYQSQRHVAGGGNRIEGVNVNTGDVGVAEDNNNAAFLKAALRHLLD